MARLVLYQFITSPFLGGGGGGGEGENCTSKTYSKDTAS